MAFPSGRWERVVRSYFKNLFFTILAQPLLYIPAQFLSPKEMVTLIQSDLFWSKIIIKDVYEPRDRDHPT